MPDPLPNLIIAGVGKAGTTSLFWYLSQHPSICRSDVKEVRYFSHLRYGEPLPPASTYRKHFRRCGDESYVMESTPGYLYGGATVARAMADLLDEPRIIVSLRDPVDRLWSYYTFVQSRARIPRDLTFEEYVDRCRSMRDRGAPATRESDPYAGFAGGFYGDHLEEWFTTFGHDLQVVFFEDLVRSPDVVVSGLCQWLGIDPLQADGFDYGVQNRTRGYRIEALQRLAVALNRQGEHALARLPRVKRALRGAYLAANGANVRRELPPDARRRLEREYADSNARVARLLSTRGYWPLPVWLHAHASEGS